MRVGFLLEGVSRFCLRRILTNSDLSEHFSSDDRIREFWELSNEERTRLWGDPIDLDLN